MAQIGTEEDPTVKKARKSNLTDEIGKDVIGLMFGSVIISLIPGQR